jgi:uncharacterized membrane protein SirB2
MIEYYLQIRNVHIACAIATGGLFLLRGVLVQARRESIANHGLVRYFSYGIDTALLTAALMLMTVLRLSPLATPWLAVKLALLVGYILLGSFALRRARSRSSKLLCFGGALLAYALMLGIARARDPGGWWLLLAK